MTENKLNAVHEYKGLWYFWNETWDKRIGSFITQIAAQTGLEIYLRNLNEQKEE